MFPASKLVFVQYVFALAVVEACRSDGLLGRVGESVRLKWPNDVYALDEGSGGSWRKVGGVLVTTSFGDGQVLVNIGELGFLGVLFPPWISDEYLGRFQDVG